MLSSWYVQPWFKANCISVLTQTQVGAGISTSAGIPDFRTPGTGLYSNLARLSLPYPEAVFDISYFKRRPEAFYTLADELYPTKFKPTRFHVFMKLLEQKGYLGKVFTQNIDTLERLAGVSDDKVIEAHGSFAQNHCISCHHEMSVEELKRQMYNISEEEKDSTSPPSLKEGQKVGIPKCKNPKCRVAGGGLVKPDIVFFGEGLPEKFFEAWEEDLPQADLVIVAGTSLTVSPFSSLPEMVATKVPRVLFNMEKVGTLGSRSRDVVSLGNCDDGVQGFVELCGWTKELDALVDSIHKSLDSKYSADEDRTEDKAADEKAADKKELNEETAAALAEEIGERIERVLPTEKEDSKEKDDKTAAEKKNEETEAEIDSLANKIDKL